MLKRPAFAQSTKTAIGDLGSGGRCAPQAFPDHCPAGQATWSSRSNLARGNQGAAIPTALVRELLEPRDPGLQPLPIQCATLASFFLALDKGHKGRNSLNMEAAPLGGVVFGV